MNVSRPYVLPTAGEQMDFSLLARAAGTVVKYAAGNTIFREGEIPTYMYFVLSGEVEIATHGKVIEHARTGHALGIISLLDNKPRTATARATVDTEVAFVDAKKFRFMVEETPNFVWFVMGELVHRLRAINEVL
jgi:CRP/FNR family cyclic AMP-dependent transcriptional regulator